MQNNLTISISQSENYVDFLMARHGETDWNKSELVENQHGEWLMGPLTQGTSDRELNLKGEGQAVDAADKISSLETPIDKIITSPLKRAARTADVISKKINMDYTIDDRFKTFSWGKCEGQTKAYFRDNFGYDAKGNYRGTDPDWKEMETKKRWSYTSIPNAGTMQEAIRGMKQAFREIARNSMSGDTVLVVTHAEMIKGFTLYCQRDEIEQARVSRQIDLIDNMEARVIANCSLNKIRYDFNTDSFAFLGEITK